MKWYIILSLLLSGQPLLLQERSAFPGAQGFGATAVGGRSGKILMVTNLNDDGPGSLREALSASGPRYVLFRTSGVIHLKRDLIIDNPFVTIDGISAPGQGIIIRGASLLIQASEVILRNLHIRTGREAGAGKDGIGIIASGPIENIIIDHCSVSWATDENIGINGRNGGIRNLTIQRCIIAEALLDHSMGMLVNKHVNDNGVKGISVINNFFAHNHERNPVFGGGTTGEVTGNLVYNWRVKGSVYQDEVSAVVLQNTWVPGPDTRKSLRAVEIRGNPVLYMKDNYLRVDGEERLILPSDSLFTPAIEPPFPLRSEPVEPNTLFASVGAYPRDSVDIRIVKSYRESSGRIITNESEAGGYPDFTDEQLYQDTDLDGIADEWEVSQGLNPNDHQDAWASHRTTEFSNLEIFLDYLLNQKISEQSDTD